MKKIMLIFILLTIQTAYAQELNVYDSNLYYNSDNVTIMASVTNTSGEQLPSSCNITVFYPNNTIMFNGSMQEINGNYFTTIHVETYGNYEYNVTCITDSTTLKKYNTFFVSNLYERIRDNIIIFTQNNDDNSIFFQDENNRECIDNETLRQYYNTTRIINGEQINYIRYKDTICENGCKSGSCVMGFKKSTIIIILVIVLIVFAFAYIILYK